MTNAKELAAACVDVATNYKTLYVMGCFGAPMTDYGKDRYTENHEYNRRPARTAMIRAATADTFGFDCVNLMKALLWGWNGDTGDKYGGAEYKSGGVPDISADQLITLCRDVSTDFGNMQIGEALWLKGHVGIYIGDGNAVECTPAWKNGVQITVVKNIKSGTGHNWTKHGKIPWVTYEDAPEESGVQEPSEGVEASDNELKSGKVYCMKLPLVQEGDSGSIVETVQQLLILRDCDPGEVDGEFGPRTRAAVMELQRRFGLEVDGKVGGETWPVLLGIN